MDEPTVYTSGDYEYILLEDGTAEITDYRGRTEELTIPAELDGYRVTAIGDNAFYGCRYLTSVSIPDSVTSIGDLAFCDCYSLTSISIPDSVAFIGTRAFAYCDSLTSVSIPDSVTSIGRNAFYKCTSLTSVSVVRGSYAEEWALARGYTCTYMKPSGQPYGDLVYRVQADGTILIVYCETVAGRVDIPAAIDGMPVTAIRANAFAGCATLRGVSIPATVTAIGENAFAGCPLITFTVERDSFAAQWCQDNGLPFVYPDAYDWLLN